MGEPEGASQTTQTHIPAGTMLVYLLFVLVLGFAAGAVVWLFFLIMDKGIAFLWETLPAIFGVTWWPLALCVVGGVLVGLFERHAGPLPPSLSTVMGEVKKTGRYEYDNMGKSAIAAILPLFFGGSIGPEAGLTGVIAGLCTWASDRMKMAKTRLLGLSDTPDDLAEIGIAATLGAVFNAPLFAFVAPLEGEREKVNSVTFPGKRKLFLNIMAIIGAIGAFALLGSLFGENGGLYRFSDMNLGNGELWWTVALIVVGCLLGYVYHLSMGVTARYGAALENHVVLRAVITGAMLGTIGIFLPYTMFAGETQMGIIVEGLGTMAAGTLIATGVVKLFMGPLCINGGWRGGNIFPVIFSGVAVGLGISLLTGIDPAFSCAVICGALCASIMRKPLTVVMLLVLCFPVKALVFVALAAVIGAEMPVPQWTRENAGADDSLHEEDTADDAPQAGGAA